MMVHTVPEPSDSAPLPSAVSSTGSEDVTGNRQWGWVVLAMPDVGEAVMVHRSPQFTMAVEQHHAALAQNGQTAAPGRRRDDRSIRRARVAVRRYCVQNQLNRIWTLTFAPWSPGLAHGEGEYVGLCACGRPRGPQGRGVALAEGKAFLRRLREHWGRSFPYVLVAERHKDGHWHLHLAMGAYLGKQHALRLWGHGYVDLRRLRAHGSDRAPGGRRQARSVAEYVAKYATKDLERGNGQSYRVAQGFGLRVVRSGPYRGVADAIDAAGQLVGGPRQVLWRSSDVPDWPGPGTMWAQYGDVGEVRRMHSGAAGREAAARMPQAPRSAVSGDAGAA